MATTTQEQAVRRLQREIWRARRAGVTPQMVQAVMEHETQHNGNGELITLEEAARRLNITVDRIENYIRRGKLHHLQQERHAAPGGYRWLVDPDEVHWCMTHPGRPGRPPKV